MASLIAFFLLSLRNSRNLYFIEFEDLSNSNPEDLLNFNPIQEDEYLTFRVVFVQMSNLT